MIAKFAEARKAAQRVWFVTGLFSRWWCKARARRERAALQIQHGLRSCLVRKKYLLWREARERRLQVPTLARAALRGVAVEAAGNADGAVAWVPHAARRAP